MRAFETELRAQLAAVENALVDAVAAGDALLADIIDSQLADLRRLGRVNGVATEEAPA